MAEKQLATTQKDWLGREVAKFPPITDGQWAAFVQVVGGVTSAGGGAAGGAHGRVLPGLTAEAGHWVRCATHRKGRLPGDNRQSHCGPVGLNGADQVDGAA